jgi:hypothetical protein
MWWAPRRWILCAGTWAVGAAGVLGSPARMGLVHCAR